MLLLFGFVMTSYTVSLIQMTSAVPVPKGLGLRQPSLDDVIFSDGVLFDVAVTSRLACTLACLECGSCLAFTTSPPAYTTSRPPMTCRGYKTQMTSLTFNVSAPASRTYYMNRSRPMSVWLESSCREDSDCAMSHNSQCFQGQCLCVPGYYFSYCQDSCVASCPQADLQPTFTKYSRCSISSHDIQTVKRCLTAEACQTHCLRHTNCRSVDYNSVGSKCFLATVTALEAAISCNKLGKADHFQRTCA